LEGLPAVPFESFFPGRLGFRTTRGLFGQAWVFVGLGTLNDLQGKLLLLPQDVLQLRAHGISPM
jgi:hypothetical protein